MNNRKLKTISYYINMIIQLSCVTMKYQSLTSNDIGTSPKFSKISGPLIISFTSKGSWGLVTGISMGFLTCCSIKMSL